VSSVVNDPLAPPHTTPDILVLIPGISRANVLRSKGPSEATAPLGDSGDCRQNGRATNDNQFPICGHFTGAERLIPAPSAIPAATAEKQDQKDDDQKSCGIHMLPSFRGARELLRKFQRTK